MVYSFTVHWIIAPVFLLTVPLLGILSSTLSRRIKTDPDRDRRARRRALAGSTTESLRNIELVKSLGLADQEVARLNGTTEKILALELKKVRYLRSLSFVQGTAVNALRTSIMFLMLYLIFTQRITVGQFFSLFIYSFFIFGPLQELGQRHQHVPRDRSVAAEVRGDAEHAARAAASEPGADRSALDARVRARRVHAPSARLRRR